MGLRPPLQHSSVTDPTGSSSLVSGYKGKSSIGIMKAIYINHGVKGLYTGYRVHLRTFLSMLLNFAFTNWSKVRDTFGTGIYFTIYESTKQLLLTLRGRKLESDNALAGGLCGILGLVFIYPVDSAKTAYQHAFFSRPGGTVKPPPITFLKPEIYKGFWVASARSALTNAIFFSVYEFLAKQIGTKNNGTLEDEHP